jgi:fimbrial chaperone protein
MPSKRTLAAALFLALSANPVPTRAMTVTPTHVEMLSVGNGSHARITVVNTGDIPLPVEAIIRRATLDDRGVPTTTEAGEDFLIMPPQALIPPGATQNFRIQWLGEPLLETSQSFLLYMTQIPLKPPAGGSVMQLVASIGVMINVAPPQGTPRLQVVDTSVVADSRGRHPMITVKNPSHMHALLPQATIRLSGQDWSQSLPPGALSETIGIGLVQPGLQRKFVLPVDLPPHVTSLDASVEFKPKQ